MCGIFGIVSNSNISLKKIDLDIKNFVKHCESRGSDTFGVSLKINNTNYVFKENQKPSESIIKNRFGGESCTLPAFAVAVYDVIMGSELLKDWNTHRKGLDWFSRNFTDEYYILLD